jgi:hypothetical protein
MREREVVAVEGMGVGVWKPHSVWKAEKMTEKTLIGNAFRPVFYLIDIMGTSLVALGSS